MSIRCASFRFIRARRWPRVSPITTFTSRSLNPVALSLDGKYAFFGTSTGIDKVRASDNVTVESFAIGGRPTHLLLLLDGLTLVATTGTTLYVIDLW